MEKQPYVIMEEKLYLTQSEILQLWVKEDRQHLKLEQPYPNKLLVMVGHCKQAIAVFLLERHNTYLRWYEAGGPSLGSGRRIPDSFRGCTDGMFEYETNCTIPSYTYSKGPAIEEMVDRSREVYWEAFRRHVHWTSVRRVFPGYSYRGEHRSPLNGEPVAPFHIKDDYAVKFHKSVYRGRPCYFITHSMIEYIFTRKEDR